MDAVVDGRPAAERVVRRWDAPIFWPAEGAFAWSEPRLSTGLLFAALQRLVGGPIPAYGLAVLVILTLNGVLVASAPRRRDLRPVVDGAARRAVDARRHAERDQVVTDAHATT